MNLQCLSQQQRCRDTVATTASHWQQRGPIWATQKTNAHARLALEKKVITVRLIERLKITYTPVDLSRKVLP